MEKRRNHLQEMMLRFLKAGLGQQNGRLIPTELVMKRVSVCLSVCVNHVHIEADDKY